MFTQILERVPAECQEQIELAVVSEGGDLDDVCKMHVQQAWEEISQLESASVETPDIPPAAKPTGSTGIIVLVFVLALLAAIGGYAAYVYNLRKDYFAEKPEKKLSKQKQLKMKMKANKNT